MSTGCTSFDEMLTTAGLFAISEKRYLSSYDTVSESSVLLTDSLDSITRLPIL